MKRLAAILAALIVLAPAPAHAAIVATYGPVKFVVPGREGVSTTWAHSKGGWLITTQTVTCYADDKRKRATSVSIRFRANGTTLGESVFPCGTNSTARWRVNSTRNVTVPSGVTHIILWNTNNVGVTHVVLTVRLEQPST